ncbi:MAG TPA: hypothetical protein VJ484_13110 [Lysobacter sp.]|nr:hypothetical protein [Lysobacter sp.]
MGPAFELIGTRSKDLAWRLIAAADGTVHVIAYLDAAKELRHIRVPNAGAPSSESIPAQGRQTPSLEGLLDAAFDHDGNLHVLADGRHLVQRSGTWQEASPPPWARERINAQNISFVPGARDLTWMFYVKGKEIGDKGYWGVALAGGFGTGIILPWHYQNQKLLVVPDAATEVNDWVVVDKEDHGASAFYMAAGDAAGYIHVYYAQSPQNCAYARIAPRSSDAAATLESEKGIKPVDAMRAVPGKLLPTAGCGSTYGRPGQRNILSNHFSSQFAIDPDSGQGLSFDITASTLLMDASQAWRARPALPEAARPVHRCWPRQCLSAIGDRQGRQRGKKRGVAAVVPLRQ